MFFAEAEPTSLWGVIVVLITSVTGLIALALKERNRVLVQIEKINSEANHLRAENAAFKSENAELKARLANVEDDRETRQQSVNQIFKEWKMLLGEAKEEVSRLQDGQESREIEIAELRGRLNDCLLKLARLEGRAEADGGKNKNVP